MHYATYKAEKSVHIHSIKSLDARIVKLHVSVRIPDYQTRFSNTHLSLYACLIRTGTASHTKEEIDDFIKRYGIELSISSSYGCIHFVCTVHDKNIHHALTLLSELIFSPKFSQREFSTKIATFLEANRESYDNAQLISKIQFRNLLYPNTHFMRMETLTEQKTNIQNTTMRMINNISKSMQSGEWYVSVVGNDTTQKALDSFIRLLAEHSFPVEQHSVETTIHQSQSMYRTIPAKTNIEIRIGNLLPISERDDDFIPFSFGLSVLGKVGGFSGRLMSTVREKEGLTYGIYAQTNSHNTFSTGHWEIFTFFSAKDLEKGITSTKRQLSKIVNEGITITELSVFKEILVNQFLIAHGSNRQRARTYHNALLNGETVLDIEREIALLKDLTVDSVNTALKKYIDLNALVISGAGPVTATGMGIIR